MRGQAVGQNDLQLVEPDSLTLAEYIDANDGPEGQPSWKAWRERVKARCSR